MRRGLGRLGVMGAIGVLLASPVLVWEASPDSGVRVVVLDATVPHPDYREHESLFWMLDHERTTPPSGRRPWALDQDYIGWFPERTGAGGLPERHRLKAADLAGADLLYVADAYGVYTEDLADPAQERTALDYSSRLWGGLDESEVSAIEVFAGKGGSVVAEFNTFGSPTGRTPRSRLEALFGVTWTEWSGRYFLDLADTSEVPAWARRHWREHYGTEWAFEGPGWLFSNEDTRLFVLSPGVHVGHGGSRISAVDHSDPLVRDVRDDVPFTFWFDVQTPRPGTQVLAWYTFDLTDEGRAVMASFGVPESFPAVAVASREPLRAYFAGDFSDNHLDRGPYWVAGMANFRSLVGARARDQRGFFWSFYAPLIHALLGEVESHRG